MMKRLENASKVRYVILSKYMILQFTKDHLENQISYTYTELGMVDLFV